MNFESMGGTNLNPAEQALFNAYLAKNPNGTVEEFIAGRAQALNKANAAPHTFEQVAGVLMEELPTQEERAEMLETQNEIGRGQQ